MPRRFRSCRLDIRSRRFVRFPFQYPMVSVVPRYCVIQTADEILSMRLRRRLPAISRKSSDRVFYFEVISCRALKIDGVSLYCEFSVLEVNPVCVQGTETPRDFLSLR